MRPQISMEPSKDVPSNARKLSALAIRQPTPLELLQATSKKSNARLATTTLEAIDQAFEFFLAAYPKQWQVAQNSQLAWLAVLHRATPDDIATAALAYVGDTTRLANGDMRARFPPQPCDIAEIVASLSAERAKRAAQREQAQTYAIASIERVVALKESGRWPTLTAKEREDWERWNEIGRGLIAKHSQPPPPVPSVAEKRSQPLGACGVAICAVALGALLGRGVAISEPAIAKSVRGALGGIESLHADCGDGARELFAALDQSRTPNYHFER